MKVKSFRFKKIDAFVAGDSTGNPAGAIYIDSRDNISAAEMQRIARELKGFVNEVGFIRRLDQETFDLRYYSSEREVDLCGHATIAIMYDLIKNDNKMLNCGTVSIVNNKGKLAIANRIQNEDAVFLYAPQPVFADRAIGTDAVAGALRVGPDLLNEQSPLMIVNAGLETLIVPFRTLDAVLALSPDLEELKQFCIGNRIDIITVFTSETANPAHAFRTRVFAPTFGYLEDPATGSGNGAFGYYLHRIGNRQPKVITIEQNGYRDNPNLVKLEFGDNANGSFQVAFGGNGVVRIAGEYFV